METVVCVMDEMLFQTVRRELTDQTAMAIGLRVKVVHGTEIATLNREDRIVALISDTRTAENISGTEALADWLGRVELISFFSLDLVSDPETKKFLDRFHYCRLSRTDRMGNLREMVKKIVTEQQTARA